MLIFFFIIKIYAVVLYFGIKENANVARARHETTQDNEFLIFYSILSVRMYICMKKEV